MNIAVRIKAHGNPKMLEVIEMAVREPQAEEIRIRHTAIGVNFIDTYHRTGRYILPDPAIPGVEGVGVVEAVGANVAGIAVGDRIVYAGIAGGYASTRVLPAWRAIPLPPAISDATAAASMLRALTAYMLLNLSYRVEAGTTLLVHAAAGGLGIVLTRWAKQIGATVIGTASTEEKARLAKRNGVDHVIIGRDSDIVGAVSDFTDGRGVDYVIDGVGGAVLRKSLRSVRPFGSVASIGWVAGRVPPFDIEELGAASLAKPSVMAYSADQARYAEGARATVRAMEAGIVSEIGGMVRLRDAADAHRALESGSVTGSLVMTP